MDGHELQSFRHLHRKDDFEIKSRASVGGFTK